MPTMFSNFIIVREDKFVLHTKRISLERAKWLLNEAYKSVDSRVLKESYLRQWGNVWRPDHLRWDAVDQLVGIYVSKEGFLLKASEVVGKKMLKNFEEFLSKPIEPKKFERHPRPPIQPPPMRYVVLYDHVRVKNYDEFYTVPKAREYNRLLIDLWFSYFDYAGISIFKKTFWLWYEHMYEYYNNKYDRLEMRDEYHTLIVRRDLSPSEVKKFINVVEPPLAKAIVTFRKEFEYTVSEISDKYDDVKELAKAVIDAIVESAGNTHM